MFRYTLKHSLKLSIRLAISSNECHDITCLVGESLVYKHNGKDVKSVYQSNLHTQKNHLMNFSTSGADTSVLVIFSFSRHTAENLNDMI